MEFDCQNLICDSRYDRIWQGQHEKSPSRVLIKELTLEGKREPVYRQRMLQEFELLKEWKHPRFLEVTSFDSTESTIFYEDVQCNLEQLIARVGHLENDHVANVLFQVGEALKFLHSRSLAHGSLTSKKIFVDPKGFVKLADFIPYRFNENPFGEPHRKMKYQAPEILDSVFGDCGPTSDLYNLGHLALELLAGPEFPYVFGFAAQHAEASPKWLQWHADPHRVLENWFETLPHVCNSMAAIVTALIAKPVNERKLDSAHALLDRIKALGLQSARPLPAFHTSQQKEEKKEKTEYCPPVRRAGQILILRSKQADIPPMKFHGRLPVIVGSTPGASIEVNAEGVDPRHALVACQQTDWFLYDLQTKSGTVCNHAKVKGRAGPLKRGDELLFGDLPMTVDIEHRGTSLIPAFDIQKRLHVSANGTEIYQAVWNRSSGSRPVALKLLPNDFSEQADLLQRFLRAINEGHRLKDPSIVRLDKAGCVRRKEFDQWYLASELMSGRSLRDKLKKSKDGKLSLLLVKKFALDISKALKVLQSHQLIHRNINPACILFTVGRVGDKSSAKFREVAKLGDFLLSRPEVLETFYQITRGQLSIGDFPYQAPELLHDSSPVDQSCDMFALAACMYEAVAGKLPVERGKSLTQTVTSFANLDWPPPSTFRPGLDAEWDRVLCRALARSPKSRFQTIDDFIDAILGLWCPEGT